MNATISVICYKSKTLSNGEHPLMLRIAQNGKSKYKSLRISINAKHWDFDKNIPKPNCPNKELINKIILKTRLEFQEKLLVKKANEEEFTASSLINEQKDEIKAQTVGEFYSSLIVDLKEKGQIGTSYAYLNSYRMLKNFNIGKKLNYTFSHINVSFCKKFEEWLRARGNKDITISYQFRTLRAAFNRAIEAKIVSRDKNPFVEFKLSHLNTKTMKRALSKKDILRIMQADCSGCKPIRQLAQDLFSFSYLCGGISFVDIANLKPRNIIDNRLIYQRQKTHGGINLQLSSEAKKVITKYADYQRVADYLFPILHYKRHITPMQKKNRVHKVCHEVNRELRALGKELRISAEVTTYVARHSFATVLKKSGVNIGIISQALGHQDIKTTQIYLSKFDNEQVDDAMKNLL
ncbi:MAG: site-specific integrase [Rikenellaceae bacterium]|nr:site-specific integrase [Rikenellaceae bacterium]